MSPPTAKDRPDRSYWNTPREKRSRLTAEEMRQLNEELAVYSGCRFPLGRCFILATYYYGIPSGTRCTVVREWPDTRIRWDPWGPRGSYGQRSERTSTISYRLDTHLVAEEDL